MEVIDNFSRWTPSLPGQISRFQGTNCPYCQRLKTGDGAILAPCCRRAKCREKTRGDFGLSFQLHCVIRGMAMGYEDKEMAMDEKKQVPGLIVRSKPERDKPGISSHAIKQYRKMIAQQLGLPNKETVLVAWYIARAMELEYAPSVAATSNTQKGTSPKE
jgi:glutaredoxin